MSENNLDKQEKEKPYWNPYLAGIFLGLVLLVAFVVVGRGLGASGAMTRLSLYTINKVLPESVSQTIKEKNPYYKKYLPENKYPLDDFLVYMFLGVLLGGFLSGLFGHRVFKEVIHGPNTTSKRRLILAFTGGLISALGARLARGCTSGQALTGGATLAVGSWVFMIAVFAGGYAIAYFLRREWL